MTKTHIILALTASVLTATSFAGAASANGVRLGFGGPMASFVASPTHGGGGRSSRNAGAAYATAKCQKKSAPVQTARREPPPQPKHYSEESKRKVTVASVERDRPARKSASHVSETVKETKAEVASNETPVVVSGSKSLVQTQVETDAANAAPATVTQPDVAANDPVPAVATIEPTTTVAATETIAETIPAIAAPAVVTARDDVGCKKFIPAVGVTVTVDCEK